MSQPVASPLKGRQASRGHETKIIHLRTIKSLVYSLWRLPLFVVLYLLLSFISIIHPVSWIQGTFGTLFSFSTWMYIILIGVINSLVAISSWKHFTVTPIVQTTRLEVLMSLFRPDRLLHAAGHAAAGGTLTWCYAGLIGGRYANLIGSCLENDDTSPEDQECLNECHVFTVFHGAFVGLLYSIQFFLHQCNYMAFPSIQQPKMFQVQNGRLPLLRSSASSVFHQLKFYYPLFWLFGGIPKHWISHTLGLKSTETAVNSIYGLLDAGLLWHVFLTGFVIYSTWGFYNMLYKIYNTERHEFPVESSFEMEESKCLYEALGSTRHALIKYLGYLDLFLLSKYTGNRRKQIFRLSQPGGHPHNWNYIVTECLSDIKALTNSITVHNNMSLTTGPITHLSGDKTPMQPTEANNNPWKADLHHRQPELLSAQQNGGVRQGQPKQVTFLEKMYVEVKKKPVFAFFLQDIPDRSSRKLFVDSQVQIWALEALSEMVAASYSEDTFGVVQKWLPDIISALLALQEAVDKHFKLATNMVRRPPRGTETSDVALRYALKTTLRTAIYRITERFAEHLEYMHFPMFANHNPKCRQFHVSVEHMRRLRMFLEHKE